MKRTWVALGLLALAGCGGSSQRETAPESALAPRETGSQTAVQQAPGDEKIASAGDIVITRRQLTEPLIEAHGLDFLVQLMTLKSAEDAARRQGITITEDDVRQEIAHTITGMFKDAPAEDHERLLKTFLVQQQITRTQFDLLMRTNAWLRKIAEPEVEKLITDEVLRDAFGMMYGENVRVRHIQLSNMQEVTEAQRRLASGEDFAEVARKMSRNVRTAPRGGEMPPFSLQMQGLPDSFKQAAFALEEGEVSDAVMAEDAYHLIKLEERIAPKAVAFEDHKETVRQRVRESFMTSRMRQLRNGIRQDILQRLDIEHPVLARQFKEQTQPAPADEAEKQRILRDLERQREEAAPREPLSATTRRVVPAPTPPAADDDGPATGPSAAPKPPAPAAAPAAATRPAPATGADR